EVSATRPAKSQVSPRGSPLRGAGRRTCARTSGSAFSGQSAARAARRPDRGSCTTRTRCAALGRSEYHFLDASQRDSPCEMDYGARLDARASALQTLCIKEDEHDATRALEPPLVLSSAFGFDDAAHAAAAFRGENDAFIYGRWGNP